MFKPRLVQVGTLAMFAAAVTAPRGALLAQGTQSAQGGQAPIQLAFGYKCDDRFVVRNDGAQSVTVEYGVAGAPQRSSLDLKGNEAIELASTTNEPLELWVGGKLVATERKGNIPCDAPNEVQNPEVVVRPIVGQEYGAYVEPIYYPAPVVYVRPIYEYGYGYGGGYGYGYSPTVRVVASIGSGFGGGYGARGRVSSGIGFRGDPRRAPGHGERMTEPARVSHVNGSTYAPRPVRSGYAPRTGGSGYAPRTGGAGHAPRMSGTGGAPRTGGSGHGQRSGGTGRGTQAGSHGHHG